MKIINMIVRPSWLIFGTIYGIIAFLISQAAGLILTTVLAPFFPSIAAMITAAEPVRSIFSDISIPWIGGILAGICIIGALLIASIISTIYWWIASWVYSISKITPLWLLIRKQSPVVKMIYAGMLIPGTLIALATLFNVVKLNAMGIVANLIQIIIQLMWMVVVVYATWFAMRLIRMKLPTETG